MPQFASVTEHSHGPGRCLIFCQHPKLVARYRFELQALARKQVHRLAQSCGNGNLASFGERSFVHGVTLSCRFIMSSMTKRHDAAKFTGGSRHGPRRAQLSLQCTIETVRPAASNSLRPNPIIAGDAPHQEPDGRRPVDGPRRLHESRAYGVHRGFTARRLLRNNRRVESPAPARAGGSFPVTHEYG